MKLNPFAYSMRQSRIRRGWTQAEFAKKLEVSQGTISFWENGVEEPSIEHQLKILELMPEVLGKLTDQQLALFDRIQALERQLFGGKCSCDNCNCEEDSTYIPISEAIKSRFGSVKNGVARPTSWVRCRS